MIPEVGDVLDLSACPDWLHTQGVSDVSTRFAVTKIKNKTIYTRAISDDKTKLNMDQTISFRLGSVMHDTTLVVGKVNFFIAIEITQNWK